MLINLMRNDKLTEFIFASQLSSVMNKTKWTELANEMTSNPEFNPEVRIKYLNEKTAGQPYSLEMVAD